MKILHGIKQKYSPIKIQVWREVAGNRLLVISELFILVHARLLQCKHCLSFENVCGPA